MHERTDNEAGVAPRRDGPLAAPRRIVTRERRRCVDEREAFAALAGAVADLETTVARPDPVAVSVPTGGSVSTGPTTERVRAAYERTVMSVPHYDEEYGESYRENLTVEFGPDLAAALTGAAALTPRLRETAAAAARLARDERVAFVELLEAERTSLDRVATGIETVRADLAALDDRPLGDRGFDDLRDLRAAVRGLGDRVDDLAAARQRTLARHRDEFDHVDPSLPAYLYAGLATDHPALAALASVGGTLATARRRVERALACAA
jgi:hypothetical protein